MIYIKLTIPTTVTKLSFTMDGQTMKVRDVKYSDADMEWQAFRDGYSKRISHA